MLVIVIICLIGLLIGSCFGIFFSGEDSGSGYTMQNVVQAVSYTHLYHHLRGEEGR